MGGWDLIPLFITIPFSLTMSSSVLSAGLLGIQARETSMS